MAITRCPYCHAIIDENDKYCNNCGTQLLFTEDEEIEEEIPGEKIIDAEIEEKDYTVEEPEDEKRPAPAKDLDSEIDEELEKELREETEEMALDELLAEGSREAEEEDELTQEVILVDEIEASEEKSPEEARVPDTDTAELATSETKAGAVDSEAGPSLATAIREEREEAAEEVGREGQAPEGEAQEAVPPAKLEEGTSEPAVVALAIEEDEVAEGDKAAEEELADVLEEEIEKELEAPEIVAAGTDIPFVSDDEPADESATAGEAGFRQPTFDSRELEDLGQTVELSQQKIDRFLEAMAEREEETPPVPDEAAPDEIAPPEESDAPTIPEPPTGTLPPWASTMKGAPVFPDETGPVETRPLRGGEPAVPDAEEETEIFPRRRASDSTIGLPEKVSQVPLPFEEIPAEAESEEPEPPDKGIEEEEPEGGTQDAAEPGRARDLGLEEAVMPAGQVRPARESLWPIRPPGPGEVERSEAKAVEEPEEPGPRPPFNFAVFVKSKSFDLLFVGLFWLAALWLAAYSMGLTLFAILGSMSGPMILLYAAFVLIYFFLFKFFLGETLGDRLFRPRE